MHIALDAVVIALFVFSVYRGIKKGFVKTAFKLVIVAAALIIAYKFSPVLTEYVKSTPTYESITGSVRQSVSQSISRAFAVEDDGSEASDTSQASDKGTSSGLLPDLISKAVIDTDAIREKYQESLSQGAVNISEITDEFIITPAAQFICRSLCFAVLFIVSVILLNLLVLLLDLIFKLPVLKSMNKVGGAAMGTVSGILKVFIFCTLVEIALLYFEVSQIGFVRGIENNTLLFKEFLKYNPLSFLY